MKAADRPLASKASSTSALFCSGDTEVMSLSGKRSAPQLRDLRPRRADELIVRMGVSPETPAAWRRFRQQHPGPRLQRWIICRRSDEVSELRHDGDLLSAVERVALVST
jgi:hypothetical protein